MRILNLYRQTSGSSNEAPGSSQQAPPFDQRRRNSNWPNLTDTLEAGRRQERGASPIRFESIILASAIAAAAAMPQLAPFE